MAAVGPGAPSWYEDWPWDTNHVAHHFGLSARSVSGPCRDDDPITAAAAAVAARRTSRTPCAAVSSHASPLHASSLLEPQAHIPQLASPPPPNAASIAAACADADADDDADVVDAASRRERRAEAARSAKQQAERARWARVHGLQPVPSQSASGHGVPAAASDAGTLCPASMSEGAASWQGGMWCEALRPRSSTDVCGNRGPTAQLKRWLQQWSETLATKAKAAKAKRSKRTKRRSRQSGESDDDFVVDSDESDGFAEESAAAEASNVMLLRGPPGSGKSAAIYACAAELGFKVIEVNASVIRSGKHILTNFAEATQSHELTKWSATNTAGAASSTAPTSAAAASQSGSGSAAASGKRARGEEAKPAGGQAAAMAMLFGGPAKAKPTEQLKGRPAKQPTAKAVERGGKGDGSGKGDVEGGPEGGGVERSLVLFEEAEVTFEEDVGFYSALRKLASASKCPIVLTCNTIPDELAEVVHESPTLTFIRPSASELLPLLTSVCACAGLRVAEERLGELIAYLGADLRQLLQTLQCWAATGSHAGPTGHSAATDAPRSEAVGLERVLGLGNVWASASHENPSHADPSHEIRSAHTATEVEPSLGSLLVAAATTPHHVGGVSVSGCEGRLSTSRSSVSSQLLLSRAVSEVGLALHRYPTLDHPLRLLDAMAAGSLLGADECELLRRGRVPSALCAQPAAASPANAELARGDVELAGGAAIVDGDNDEGVDAKVGRRARGRPRRVRGGDTDEDGTGEAGNRDGSPGGDGEVVVGPGEGAGPARDGRAARGSRLRLSRKAVVEDESDGHAEEEAMETDEKMEVDAMETHETEEGGRAEESLGVVQAPQTEAADADADAGNTAEAEHTAEQTVDQTALVAEEEVKAAEDAPPPVQASCDDAGMEKADAAARTAEPHAVAQDVAAETLSPAVDSPAPQDVVLEPDHERVQEPPVNAWAFPQEIAPAELEAMELATSSGAHSAISSADHASALAELEAVVGLLDAVSAVGERLQQPPSTLPGPDGASHTMAWSARLTRADIGSWLSILGLLHAHSRLPASAAAGGGMATSANGDTPSDGQAAPERSQVPLERSLLLLPCDETLAASAAATTAASLLPIISRVGSNVHAAGVGGCSGRDAHVEYVGMLRTIARLERGRKAGGLGARGRVARRFQHALGRFGLDDDDVALLAPLCQEPP